MIKWPFAFTDRLWSIHVVPLACSLATATLLYSFGYASQLCLISAGGGVAITGVGIFLLPVVTLRAVGGRYFVSLREVNARAAESVPPLTIFYPTLVPPPPGRLDWLPFGDVRYLHGMARYVSLPPFLLTGMMYNSIAANVNAPGLPLMKDNGATPRTVIIFSHGLAGFARLYSSLLMDLAARGVLVIALNHMDASASYCRDATNDPSISKAIDVSLGWNAVHREPQLSIRIKETTEVLKRFYDGSLLGELGYEKEDVQEFLSCSPKVTLMGHSFGGATALATALHVSSHDLGRSIASVVACDPWRIPLAGPLFRFPISSGTATYTMPTLLVHSEEWVRDIESWDFFVQLEALIKEKHTPVGKTMASIDGADVDAASSDSAREWYVTRRIGGTSHLSWCDIPLLSPVVFKKSYVTVPPRVALVELANMSHRFAEEHSVDAS